MANVHFVILITTANSIPKIIVQRNQIEGEQHTIITHHYIDQVQKSKTHFNLRLHFLYKPEISYYRIQR